MRALTAALVICAGCAMAQEASLRPVPRPTEAPAAIVQEPAPPKLLQRVLRPFKRPASVEKRGRAAQKARARGAVCGDPAIQGEPVGRVPGRLRGCGLQNAVRVRSVAGVGLSQHAVLDCTTAKALKRWVEKSAKPALRRSGGGLRQLRVAAHFACRTRNNQPGAKISEHGRGRAIDISGFKLADGRVISVLEGWNARSSSRALRAMHKGACGPFGTVLGPKADRFHRDHFHFDTARHRSGPYCR